ncbi:MAG: hypothetical protein RRY53_05805 [Pseudoflavonifractor sp.]
MSEINDQQFRSVAFGGFHKQDVLNYIETATKNHTEKIEALQRALEDSLAAKAALEKQTADTETQLAQTEQDLAHAAAELETARGDLEKQGQALAAAEHENRDLTARLKQAEPAAEAYAAVKDHTAGIELEAYHRAQDVLDEAAGQAAKVRAEVEQWIIKLQGGYDLLRTDVDATISHANGALDHVAGTLAGISAELAQRDTNLDALLRTYREATALKAPQPLPLDGE